jgi:hypothetical protein
MKVGIGLLIVTLVAGCGGGGGGGGSGGWPTRWKDTMGNDNYIPELGETAVATLAFDEPASNSNAVHYSATDPDLLFVEGGVTAAKVYAGRISTARLDSYCTEGVGVSPANSEGRTGLFAFVGDDLVVFAGDGERIVCGPGLTKSRARAAYFTAEPIPSFIVEADDGFWFLQRTAGATIGNLVHVRYDGTDETVPSPAFNNFLVDKRGRAFYFMQGTEATKFDTATVTTSVVATGLQTGALYAVNDQGLFASLSGIADMPIQYVTFARGTTPLTTPARGNGFSVTGDGDVPYYLDGGAGVAIRGRRYDTASGNEMQITLTNVSSSVPFTSYPMPLLKSGHQYLLSGDFHQIGVASRPTTSNSIMFDVLNPDFKLTTYPTATANVMTRSTMSSFSDGTCLVTTEPTNGTGTSTIDDAKTPGSIVPITQWGATVSVTPCGGNTGKTLAVGFFPAADSMLTGTFGSVIPIDKPYLSAMHFRYRETPCETCNADGYEAKTYQMFMSAWTVTADGTTKPLFAHANFAWLRSHSLANFVVRHDDKLVVVAGDGS